MKSLFFTLAVLSARACQSGEAWFPQIEKPDDGQAAITELHKKLKSRTAGAQDYYELGYQHLFSTKDTSLASLYLRQACRLDSNNVEARFLFSLALERRGDYEAALQPLLDICKQNPNEPLGELAARTIRSYIGKFKSFSKSVEPAFSKILKNSQSSNPEFIRVLSEVLAAVYRRTGRLDRYYLMQEQMGVAGEWLLLGPFGEQANIDFDHPFPPEVRQEPLSECMWKGKKLTAKPMTVRGENIYLVGGRKADRTYYAGTFLNLSKTEKLIIRIISVDNLKVFVDEQEVFRRDTRKTWPRVTDQIVLELSAGRHSVLVKFSSRQFASGFRLYVVNQSGIALSSDFCSISPGKDLESVNGKLEAIPYRSPVEAKCDEILERYPENAWANYVKAWISAESGNLVDARLHSEKALAAAPHFAEFSFYLARHCKDDPSLSFDDASELSRRHYQMAAELVDEFAAALNELSHFDIDENNHLVAIDTLENCVRINPEFAGYRMGLFSALRAKGWNDLATDSLRMALDLNPGDPATLPTAKRWFERRNDFQNLQKCVHYLQQIYPDSSYRARHHEDSGNLDEAAEAYSELVKLRPRIEAYRLLLAGVLRRKGDFAAAEKVLDETLDVTSRPANVYQRLATVRFQAGNLDGGTEALESALKNQPANLSVRQALINLGREDEFKRYRVSYESVVSQRDKKRKYRQASTVYLLDQFVTRVFSDGTSIDLTHIISLVMDKGGVERMGEIFIPRSARILNLRVIKPDGKVIEPELLAKKQSYTMSGLASGDVVDYEYLEPSSGSGIAGGYPGANFTFNSIATPTELAELVVMTDPDYAFKYHFRNANVKPKIETREGMKVYQWKMKNPHAVYREPAAVPYQEYIPHVQFSGGLSWEAIRRRFANDLMGQLKVSREMKKALDEAVAGAVSFTDKAKRIYSMASERVSKPGSTTYFRRPAYLIYSEREGNLLVLLKALYDRAGVPCDAVLTYSLSEALPVLDVPSFGTFRHGLLRVRPDEKSEVWLDPRGRTPFGYLNPLYGGAKGLIMQPSGPLWMDIPAAPAEQDHIRTTWTGTVNGDGGLDARVVTEYTGLPAASVRGIAENYSEQQWIQIVERMLSRWVRGAEVKSVRISNAKDLEKSVRFEYDFQARRFVLPEGNHHRLGQFLETHRLVRRFAMLPGRRISLHVRGPVNTVVVTELKFPGKTEFIGKPNNALLKTPFGKYECKSDVKGTQIRFERSLRLPIQRIKPKDYPAFSKFCRSVDENESESILLKLKP